MAKYTQERDVRITDIAKDNPRKIGVEIQRDGQTVGYWFDCEWDGRCPRSRKIEGVFNLTQETKDE